MHASPLQVGGAVLAIVALAFIGWTFVGTVVTAASLFILAIGFWAVNWAIRHRRLREAA
jgi:ABC-type transport system involved in Fe-S cluster assembly fused permease/ATPase subunit